MKKSRRSPAPKKCTQTVCGNTCIKKGYRCKDDDPKAQSTIRRKTSALKRAVDKEVEAAFKTGRAKQAESVIKNLTKKRSKTETMKQGSAILEKYGTPSSSRTAVDRMVEAGTKTRRKPLTESEKTAKVLKREQAQRVIRELQQEEKKVKELTYSERVEKARQYCAKYDLDKDHKELTKVINKFKDYSQKEFDRINSERKIKGLEPTSDLSLIKPRNSFEKALIEYEIVAARNPTNKDLDRVVSELDKEMGKGGYLKNFNKLLKDLKKRDSSVKNETVLSPSMKVREAEVKEFLDMLPKQLSKDITIAQVDNVRSFSRDIGSVYQIVLRTGSPKDVLFHELAHLVEIDSGGSLSKLARDWIMSRATSKELEPMGKPYSPDEKAYKGKFFHPYLGKVYRNGATEVYSMSLQYFSGQLAARDLYRTDPELFYLGLSSLLD